MIEEIIHDGKLYAIIIRSNYSTDGIKFFTQDSMSQQLGYMKRPADYHIEPHYHNFLPREVTYTSEVLFIRSGTVIVDFYDDFRNKSKSITLYPLDVILLANGGHSLTMLEESEIIEVKQGPYTGDQDKTRFTPSL